jgi:hypothetical protein
LSQSATGAGITITRECSFIAPSASTFSVVEMRLAVSDDFPKVGGLEHVGKRAGYPHPIRSTPRGSAVNASLSPSLSERLNGRCVSAELLFPERSAVKKYCVSLWSPHQRIDAHRWDDAPQGTGSRFGSPRARGRPVEIERCFGREGVDYRSQEAPNLPQHFYRVMLQQLVERTTAGAGLIEKPPMDRRGEVDDRPTTHTSACR